MRMRLQKIDEQGVFLKNFSKNFHFGVRKRYILLRGKISLKGLIKDNGREKEKFLYKKRGLLCGRGKEG
ncbi:MAG: hypothetical protein HPY78_00010 [Brevinematales bacterium]|nr:hypothetical protein [Brevinematales bacterium]